MNNKNLIQFLIFVFALTLLGHFGLSNIYNTDSSQSIENSVIDIQKSLQEEENAVWDLITTQTGVTLEQCKQNQQKYQEEETLFYKKSNEEQIKKAKKLSSSIQQLIAEVFTDFDIDIQSIDIISYKGNGNPAAADDWTLFVDEVALLSYPIDAQYFILGHESVHIKCKDHSTNTALQRLIKKNNKATEVALTAFGRFQETRADILAMLKGDKYVEGGISFFQVLREREGANFEIPSHPKTSDRIAWAENIRKIV